MTSILVETHGHSKYSDGKHSPKEIVQAAIKRGLGGIALTDHDTSAGLGELMAVAKKAQDNGVNIIPLPGVEVTTDRGHVAVYFPGDTHDSDNLKWAGSVGVHNGRPLIKEVVRRTIGQGGIVIFNHPGTPHIGSVEFDDIKRVADGLTDDERSQVGIEGINWMGLIIPGSKQREAAATKVALEKGLAILAGTDYHRADQVGRQVTVFVTVFDSEQTPDDIRQAFIARRVRPGDGTPMTLLDRAGIVYDLREGFVHGVLSKLAQR